MSRIKPSPQTLPRDTPTTPNIIPLNQQSTNERLSNLLHHSDTNSQSMGLNLFHDLENSTGKIQSNNIQLEKQSPTSIIKLQMIRPVSAEISCRICLETNQNKSNKIITPCKCAGSMGCIHEECLKTWIVSRNKQIVGASCEICKFEYKMQFVSEKVCAPSHAWSKNKGNGSALFCILLVFGFLLSIQILLILQLQAQYEQNENENENDESQPNQNKQNSQNSSESGEKNLFLDSSSALIGFCVFLFLLLIPLFCFMMYVIKQSCLIKSIKEWNIIQFTHIVQAQNHQRQSFSLQESSNIHQVHDSNGQEMQHLEDQSNILQEQENFGYLVKDNESLKSFSQSQISKNSQKSKQSASVVLSLINPRFQTENFNTELLSVQQRSPQTKLRVFLEPQYIEEGDLEIIES